MSALIVRTSDSMPSEPVLVLGYEASRSVRTVVHDLIGGGIAVTHVEPRPRSGILELLFETEATATACVTLHAADSSFEIVATDRPGIAMTYVVAGGDLSIALDDETRELWVLRVPFQEIDP